MGGSFMQKKASLILWKNTMDQNKEGRQLLSFQRKVLFIKNIVHHCKST